MEFSEEQKQKIMEAMQKHINKETDKMLLEYGNTLSSVVDKLENCGWTLPTELGIYAVNIIGNTDEIADIDKFLCGYFTRNNYEYYNKMVDGILASSIDDGLKKLINECRFAFDNKKYAICADSLVSAIEGILSTFWADKTNIRMMQVCQSKVDELANETKHITKKYLWVSYNKFIRKLYEKNDFNADEPSFINRHWLLHGRSAYEIEEIDCLRLFNAVSSICVIVNSENKQATT